MASKKPTAKAKMPIAPIPTEAEIAQRLATHYRLIGIPGPEAKPDQEYAVHELLGSDDREKILAWDTLEMHPTNDVALGLSGDWVLTGLYEYHNGGPKQEGLVSINLALDHLTMLPHVTLFDLVSMIARLHTMFFPHGNHRYFEVVRVFHSSQTIHVSCGS